MELKTERNHQEMNFLKLNKWSKSALHVLPQITQIKQYKINHKKPNFLNYLNQEIATKETNKGITANLKGRIQATETLGLEEVVNSVVDPLRRSIAADGFFAAFDIGETPAHDQIHTNCSDLGIEKEIKRWTRM